MGTDGIYRGSQVSDTQFVEALQRQYTQANPETSGIGAKIPSQNIAASQQAERPETPTQDPTNIAQKILGYSLIGVGITAGAALLPITLPLGLLGAGIGTLVGKGIEKLMNAISEAEAKKAGTAFTKEKTDAGFYGAAAGVSLGTLLTGALVLLGGYLVKNANDRASISKDSPEVKPKADIKVKSPKTQEIPDPDGVKSLMDLSRTALEAETSYGTGDNLKLEYRSDFESFDVNEKGPKYVNFFTTFNKEIALRIKISEDKTFLANPTVPENSKKEVKASLDEKLETLVKLVADTNSAYEEAISPQR